jgi:hypothetical protein
MTQDSAKSPLQLALVGLDARAENLFRMFFRGPCQEKAVVVSPEHAQATLIDLDVPQGRAIYQQHLNDDRHRTIILLSISEQTDLGANVVFVKKPAQAQSMMDAIERASRLAESHRRAAQPTGAVASEMKVIRSDSATRARPRQAASLLDEQMFKSYLGYRDDIDPNDASRRAQLFYLPRDYLQGHIQSAWEIALTREQPTRLETPWRPVSLLPNQRLAFVDADEPQLRAVCSIPFKNIASVDIGLGEKQALSSIKMITPEEVESIVSSKSVMPIESFLWKIALLTSKGRLPDCIDPSEPLGLKRWPNMTRLMLPPHGMRIASLLVNEPTTPFQAASRLGIRQQYVFAFISAAWVLNLVFQPTEIRQHRADQAVKQPERVSLLRKLLNRLTLGHAS